MGRVKTFRPLDFVDWRAARLKEVPPDERVTCPACTGTGFIECCECGYEKTCGECDETGQVEWSDLSDVQKAMHVTREAYIEALLKDARALAGWLGKDLLELLVASGFAPFSAIHSKALSLNFGEGR